MPVKRSRAGRSTAYLDSADAAPGKLTKSDASADAERPKLLHFASPVNTVECAADRTKIGGFLERCHYCNKRIAQNSDVFMYSNLCAFCSVECRECQINLDKLAGKKPQH
ncbi:FCS-Like Zinc finger 15-like isoform X2 [Salvia hispanica]|uniref:FCS-Like Zinc finger 15-like isoform X2 n=1 Tax=Salvia hispanica TaxID=49212 RepID=UPI0020091FC3|nr:FCS-Like Zinc finger 15-like isoform X2 [Salvia hispanica]